MFPDWPGHHDTETTDCRETLLVPFGRGAVSLSAHQRVILDSGAFARSFSRESDRQPIDDWMRDLAAWYRAIRTHDGARVRWCVAPDVFGNPRATWDYWQRWHEQYPDVQVAPVLQFWSSRPTDLLTIRQEARRYGPHPIVCLSNPAKMTAAQWGTRLTTACSLIRQACGTSTHIHLLGAGWSPADILLYRQCTALSSLDSITYYLAAQRGERWCSCSTCHDAATHWSTVALHHARVLSRS